MNKKLKTHVPTLTGILAITATMAVAIVNVVSAYGI